MNMDNVNKWLTLTANLGVIAGIVFLAIEVNQNSQMMKAQTRSDIAQTLVDFQMRASEHEYSSLFNDENNIAEYSSEELTRYINYLSAKYRMWENMYYQYQNGLFEESEFVSEREVWRTNVNAKNQKILLCTRPEVFSDDFYSELVSLMETPC